MRAVSAEALAALEADLVLLQNMSLAELRAFWSARWGLPPRLRSVALVRHLIAWRLQSPLLGGLDPVTRALLQQKSLPRPPRLRPGTTLTREYRGDPHQVEVGETAFIYAGQEYGSLSEVACAITGTRWNGPKFFGLRDGADRR